MSLLLDFLNLKMKYLADKVKVTRRYKLDTLNFYVMFTKYVFLISSSINIYIYILTKSSIISY